MISLETIYDDKSTKVIERVHALDNDTTERLKDGVHDYDHLSSCLNNSFLFYEVTAAFYLKSRPARTP